MLIVVASASRARPKVLETAFTLRGLTSGGAAGGIVLGAVVETRRFLAGGSRYACLAGRDDLGHPRARELHYLLPVVHDDWLHRDNSGGICGAENIRED